MKATASAVWDGGSAAPSGSRSAALESSACERTLRRQDETNFRRRDLLVALSAVVATFRSGQAQPARPYRVSLVFTTTRVTEMAAPEPSHPGARMFLDTLKAAGISVAAVSDLMT